MLLLLLSVASAMAAAPPDGPLHCDWQRHNLLIEFHNLPKRYSCNELWYKLHDVLLRLGADTRMDILPYRCEAGLGANAYSPRVRLKFYMPVRRSGTATRAAGFTAQLREVRIAPGEPRRLDEHDCSLLRQMRRSLPAHMVSFRLDCHAPPRGNPPFSLTYQALVPIKATPAQASAATGPPR